MPRAGPSPPTAPASKRKCRSTTRCRQQRRSKCRACRTLRRKLMANPHKGEVEFEAGGRMRTLRLDTNAMCELEEEFDMGIMRVLAHLELGRMTDIRRIFRAALDGNPSLEEV